MTALRPEYTELLAKELTKQSVNIYGESGQGQWRLLEDLKDLLSKENKLIFLLNMKNYSASYQGFITDISGQLKQYFPAVKQKAITDFSQFLTVFDECATGQHMVLLLHNYNSLLDNPQLDEAYDIAFFNGLNALRNSGHRLVCVTVKPHNQSIICFNKQAVGKSSWLDLKPMELFFLTEQQIKNELSRLEVNLITEWLNLLVNCIQEQTHSYEFLEFVVPRLNLKDHKKLKFEQRLKYWQKEFSKTDKSAILEEVNNAKKLALLVSKVTGVTIKNSASIIGQVIQKFLGKPN